jgi:hypothetical protein
VEKGGEKVLAVVVSTVTALHGRYDAYLTAVAAGSASLLQQLQDEVARLKCVSLPWLCTWVL